MDAAQGRTAQLVAGHSLGELWALCRGGFDVANRPAADPVRSNLMAAAAVGP